MSNSGELDLPTAELWRLGEQELLDQLAHLETVSRQVESAMLAVLGEAEARRLAISLGYRSMVEVQYAHLTITRAEAKRRMERVRALATGSFPAAASALETGEIGAAHLDQLIAFKTSLSETVEPDTWAAAEPELVGAAKAVDPTALRRFLARQIGPRLDPDGHLPDQTELAEPANTLTLDWGRNGWLHYKGRLDPETAALFAAQIEPGAAPRPTTPEEGPDTRTPERRRGDAMAEWVWLGRDGIPLHADGGERPQVTVTIGLDALMSGLGAAALGPDQLPISVSEARRLACDCKLVPLVLNAESMPLDIGRATRSIPPHIRRAVVDRDKGCTFPGCDRPPTHCQAHHVVEWQHGGATKLANLALLCGRHHRIIHHTEWEIRMRNGRPEFLPPSYLDPLCRPCTNIVHGANP